MQPLYCTWEANGRKVHTPGRTQSGRVTAVKGWVNSALGEMVRIEVESCGNTAQHQETVKVEIRPAEGTAVTMLDDGTIMISRKR